MQMPKSGKEWAIALVGGAVLLFVGWQVILIFLPSDGAREIQEGGDRIQELINE